MDDTEINLELDIEDGEETPEKKPESIEARKARLERQLSQINKKLGNSVEKKAVEPVEKKAVEPVEKKEGLDRIDKAILRAEKITDADEIALAQDIKRETGKDIEDVLESRYFKAELKAMREEKNVQDAIPSNSKRSMNSNRNTVEYWIAKGEMPPASETQLRRDYVNAKVSKAKSTNMFSDNPIA